MEIKEFERKPFTVRAVQVTLDNVEEVAKWCEGTVAKEAVKILGSVSELPCIRIEGQGANKGQIYTASLGHWVIELKGSFRAYKPVQFDATFAEKRQPATRSISETDTYEQPTVDVPNPQALESSL